jgi:antibiotic biosynthesis monooxygenase (ABM) superfamily enzyme
MPRFNPERIQVIRDALEGGKSANEDLDGPVTAVIRHRPLADAVGRYEDWLKEIASVAQQFAGHRGVNVIRPHGGGDVYTIVVHFDTVEHLRKWLDSDVRARLVRKIRPLLRSEENIDIKTGLEFWFTPPPGGKPAKPYKQFLVTFSAILPLTILVPWLLHPLFASYPTLALPLISHFIIAAAIVGIMTYVVMPHYTRLVARWLFR